MKEEKAIENPVIILTGPTAIGKTELSLKIAGAFNCEIVSVDSMQIYRFMDIGTAKVSLAERSATPHHLIDIVDPDQDYSAAQFSSDALACIQEIHDKNKVPLLTGGTGLYFKALTKGLFKNVPADNTVRKKLLERGEKNGYNVLHEELLLNDYDSGVKIHINDRYRIVRALEVFYSTGIPLSRHISLQQSNESRFTKLLTIGLTCERQHLYRRINQRTSLMLQGGLEEEVRSLLNRGYDRNLKSMQSIGYRHMLKYIFKEWTINDMEEKLARDTRRYAKRQYTWFNKDPSVHWFDHGDYLRVEQGVDRFLNRHEISAH